MDSSWRKRGTQSSLANKDMSFPSKSSFRYVLTNRTTFLIKQRSIITTMEPTDDQRRTFLCAPATMAPIHLVCSSAFDKRKLKHFFKESNFTCMFIIFPPLQVRSTFGPDVSNPSINTFCRIVEQLRSERTVFAICSEFVEGEKTALIELITDNDVVVKLADKTGGALVLLDVHTYRLEILS